MEKIRKSLLQQIYDGEFYPGEKIVSGDPDYESKGNQGGAEIDYILSCLNDEDKARFNKLIDLMDDMDHLNGYANFTYGLRTGILLMFELFGIENRHPFKERR